MSESEAVDGVLIQQTDGSVCFVPDTVLAQHRVQESSESEARQLLDDEVVAFGWGGPLAPDAGDVGALGHKHNPNVDFMPRPLKAVHGSFDLRSVTGQVGWPGA